MRSVVVQPQSDERLEPPDLLRSLAFVATFCSGMSVLSAAAIFVARSGLDTPVRLLATCVALLAAAVYAPFLMPRSWSEKRGRHLLVLVSLAVVLSPMAMFLVARGSSVWSVAYFPMAVAGFARAFPHLAGLTRKQVAVLIVGSFVGALYFFSVANSQRYPHVYSPEFSVLGLLEKDDYLNLALASMIQEFGRPLTGFDGVNITTHYHYGSHWWFASVAAPTGSRPLFSYPIGMMTVILPALLYTVVAAAATIRRRTAAEPAGTVLVALAFLMLLDQLGWRTYFSQSYVFSIVVLVAAVPHLLKAVESAATGRPESAGGWWSHLALAMGVVALATLMKVSTGLLFAVALGYVGVRAANGPGRRAASLLPGLVGLVVARTVGGSRNLAISPLEFVSGHFGFATLVASFVLPLLLLATADRDRLAAWRRGLGAGLAQRRTVLEEVVVVVMLAAMVPVALTFNLPRGSQWYFLNFAQWLVLPILVARVSMVEVREAARSLLGRRSTVIVGVLVTATAILTVGRAGIPVEVSENARVMLAEVRTSGSASVPDLGQLWKDSLVDERVLFGHRFRKALAATYGARAAALTADAARTGRGTTAVLVPPSNRRFWTLSDRCSKLSWFLPTTAAVPMLKGLPPAELHCKIDRYGHEPYPASADTQEPSQFGVCTYARRHGVDRVLVLRDAENARANRMLHCS